MKVSDRRLAGRFRIGIPLRFHLWKSPSTEQTAQSVNISERGLYFETGFALTKGAVLKLSLEMPREVTGAPAAEWSCLGTVVRTDQVPSQAGRVGVGVRLDAYEITCAPDFSAVHNVILLS